MDDEVKKRKESGEESWKRKRMRNSYSSSSVVMQDVWPCTLTNSRGPSTSSPSPSESECDVSSAFSSFTRNIFSPISLSSCSSPFSFTNSTVFAPPSSSPFVFSASSASFCASISATSSCSSSAIFSSSSSSDTAMDTSSSILPATNVCTLSSTQFHHIDVPSSFADADARLSIRERLMSALR
eukprot:TRINITY_DN4002_c0_g1_i1.p1 TRINITY_DN4002_c0_g1~~TRINITY_DN4002_c0_g1_i1.p1  ORF type:complete len:183 (-),score=76.38 TRINITY_DN4002_c0_g1_i1:351-899(-)